MKLKLVVASMSVLGMISCPVFAATQAPTTTTKHKHHHKVVHQQVVASRSYKGEEMIAPMASDWYNRIAIDGGINFDTKWGNRHVGYEGENNQRFSLNDVHFNVTAPINDWVKVVASLSYDNASQVLPGVATMGPNPLAPGAGVRIKPGIYDNIKDTIGGVNIEQGYVKFENASQSPVYVTVGKQFVDFGKYNLHPITQPLTQVMSETLRNAVTAGFNTNMISSLGVFGSVYAFESPYKQELAATTVDGGTVPVVVPAITGSTQSHAKTIYGGRLGIGQTNDSLSWDLSADYIYNMIGVEGVAYGVGLFNGSNVNGAVGNNGSATGGTFESRVGGFALNGDLKTGAFDVEIRYVTALQAFNVYDLSKNVYPTATLSTQKGAKPWAAGVNAGYAFNAMDKNQNIYVGYQGSENSVNLFMPQSRWIAGYGVDVMKNTNVGLELDHDIDYSVSNGGTGNSNNQLGLRVAVKFG